MVAESYTTINSSFYVWTIVDFVKTVTDTYTAYAPLFCTSPSFCLYHSAKPLVIYLDLVVDTVGLSNSKEREANLAIPRRNEAYTIVLAGCGFCSNLH